MLYDLRAELGLDLFAVISDLVSDEPTRGPVEILTLIEGLPDNGALAASVQGGRKFRGWGVDRHMAADTWDAMLAVAYGQAGSKKKPPIYPRPSARPKRTRTLLDIFRTTGGGEIK